MTDLGGAERKPCSDQFKRDAVKLLTEQASSLPQLLARSRRKDRCLRINPEER